jgi:manganese transport protein
MVQAGRKNNGYTTESNNKTDPPHAPHGTDLSSPDIPTPPFCASEIEGTVTFDPTASFWKKLFQFMGPGFLIAVGYMDPGNWATDIEAGSRFGSHLLFVVAFSSLAAIVLQSLSMRLGIVTGKDLARITREHGSKRITMFMWLMAEVSIVACDLAEVLGGALAFHLLLGVPLICGVMLTVLDTAIVLGLKGRNFRVLEAIILGLILTIGICYLVELVLIKPFWPDVLAGFVPRLDVMQEPRAVSLAVGIIGATIMPHNLYLHSSVVLTRIVAKDPVAKNEAIRLSFIDTTISLFFALLINCAILILAACAFHAQGQIVADISDAYNLLRPLTGSTLAPLLFAIALLASGQSSTFTGTVAGQVILEGFLDIKIPCWQRRLITRGLALLPALIGVWCLGDKSIGQLLVLSQIILSLQLPFAMYPLIRRTGDKELMGPFTTSNITTITAWIIFLLIIAANAWMIWDLII